MFTVTLSGRVQCPYFQHAKDSLYGIALIYPTLVNIELIENDTEIEFTRWLESFHKSLQTAAVKRRRELSPFISFKNSANNLQHIGEVHEVFEALKIAIEPSESIDTATLLLSDGFDGRHKFDYDIIIIGRANIVTLACVKESLKFGAKVAVIEYSNSALIEVREDYHVGSWKTLREDVRHHLAEARAMYHSELTALVVDHLNYAGKFVSPHALEFFDIAGNKQVVSSARFIIVTGSRPTLLNCPGAENALTLEELFLKEEAPGKTCIVGSGYAALQCASFLTKTNQGQVTVLLRSTELHGFDRDVMRALCEHLRTLGTEVQEIPVRLPSSIQRQANGKLLVTYGFDNIQEEFDAVISAFGSSFDPSRLGFSSLSGMHPPNSDNVGKLICKNGQTSLPYIYALGDVTHDGPDLPHVALAAAKALVQRLYRNSSNHGSRIHTYSDVGNDSSKIDGEDDSAADEDWRVLDTNSDLDSFLSSKKAYQPMYVCSEALQLSYSSSKLIKCMVLILWMLTGTLFYALAESMGFAKGLYMTVDIGMRIGYSAPYSIDNAGSATFSVFFLFFGIFFFALVDRNVFRGNCAKADSVRHYRLLYIGIAVVIWIVVGILWSALSLNLTFINSLLNSVSFMWAWGIYSLSDLSDEMYVVASIYAFSGAVLIALFYSYCASEVEVSIEKYILRTAASAPFTTAEIVWLKTVRNLTERVEDADTDTDLLLTYEEVKKVVLRRVREVDVSAVYRTLRSWLPLYYAVLIVLGLLFYMFYGESDSWSAALNYALSSWYKLGESTPNNFDAFAKLFSIVYMLLGTLLFLLLSVSIIRDFSLQPVQVRRFHTYWIGGLVLLFFVVSSISFALSYGWPYFDSMYFAMCIMTDMGSDKLQNESNVNYWIVDAYTIVSIPLFAIFISHLASEIDVMDQESYVKKLIREVFNQQDMKLMEIFDSTWTLEREGYGVKEYNLLLIIRLQDMHDYLSKVVNEQFIANKKERDAENRELILDYNESDSLLSFR